jgi:hypothetical protein
VKVGCRKVGTIAKRQKENCANGRQFCLRKRNLERSEASGVGAFAQFVPGNPAAKVGRNLRKRDALFENEGLTKNFSASA